MYKLSALVVLSISASFVSGLPLTAGRRETGQIPDGQFCGADVDCQSNNCQLVNSLFTCVPPGSTGDGSTLSGPALDAPPPAPQLNTLADGEFCGADVDCQSNNCQLVNSLFTCVPPGSTGDGSTLSGPAPDAPPPAPQLNTLADGEFCGADVDCQSNNCQLVNSLFTCVPPGSAGDGSTLPRRQLNSLADGEFCGADVDCQSNNCQLVNSLFTCVPPGSTGDGSTLPRRQLNSLADGEFCGADVDCQSNNCQLVNSLFTCVPPSSTGDGSTL